MARGQRLRLMGVNITFGSIAPRHEDADIVARRLARFGINIVRLHHMDTAEAPYGLLEKDRITFNAEYLDRMDYFIGALKREGIYTVLNLHVGRRYPRMGELWAHGASYWQGVDNRDEPAQAVRGRERQVEEAGRDLSLDRAMLQDVIKRKL